VSDLPAARAQMALSLAFHIIFAVVGIGMPVLMVIAERRWRATGDAIHFDLAKRWAKGTAILFAVGAVSGTILSFELGLLWPGFMEFAGPIIGMPFSLERSSREGTGPRKTPRALKSPTEARPPHEQTDPYRSGVCREEIRASEPSSLQRSHSASV
jgi:hypothetical protein